LRFRLIPREEAFFDLFEELATKVSQGSSELLELLKNYEDVDRKAGRVVDIEHEGDDITHEIMRRLNTTFVTPFDSEDIQQLGSHLDDVLDHIEAAAEFLQLHRIEEPIPQMIRMAETLNEACQETARAMPNLRTMKNLSDYWISINRLENDADRAYRRSIAELFSGDYKPMDVLKWKDIIEEIEQAVDKLEDVANTIEGIVLKNG
jgi:uncharacterized protein